MTRAMTMAEPAPVRPVTNLAAGWYAATASTNLRRTPERITLFGETFVGWRDRHGRARVQSAVCPHMGAALHGGRVVDGTIECPFHRWRFDPDGRCVVVPGRRPSARVALRVLPTRECSGYVWAWFGSGEPTHEPPDVPALDRRTRRPRLRRFRLADATRATPRRILENTYDPDHLIALHGLTVAGDARITFPDAPHGDRDGAPPERFDAMLTWPAYRGGLGTVSDVLGLNAGEFTLRVRGWASCQQIEYFADRRRLYEMVLAVTPVCEHHSIQHIAAAVDPDGRGVMGRLRALVHRAEVQVAARQDLPIFDTLQPGDRHGIYVPGDEALRNFRRFYQRWVDTAHRD